MRTGTSRANAERKMREKNLDMIVANTPDVIGQPDTTVEIKSKRSRWISIRRAAKTVIAHKIVRLIEKLFMEAFQAEAELR